MKTAYYNISHGILKITYENDVLYELSIVDYMNKEDTKTDFTLNVFSQVNEYLIGKRKKFDLKYKLIGTKFQISVWNELEKIPYGQTKTYKEIAKCIGNEKSCRAVGNACGNNPICIIVPCHRVIGSNEQLIGYALGLNLKKELLILEKKHYNAFNFK